MEQSTKVLANYDVSAVKSERFCGVLTNCLENNLRRWITFAKCKREYKHTHNVLIPKL